MNKIRIILIICILISIALSACDSSGEHDNSLDTKPKNITNLPTARPTTVPILPGDVSVKPKCIYPPLTETPIPD